MKLDTYYQQFIAISRYTRWLSDEGRRETPDEAVSRYIEYFKGREPKVPAETWEKIEKSIKSLDVMPSMRALMTAGPALDRDNTAGYNCAYLPVDHPRAFDEAMYILFCGTGVGYSVELKNTSQLPLVPKYIENSGKTVVIPDSKEGWARAVGKTIRGLYYGQRYEWDFSRIRPEGARLKTFGGRASGPEPLIKLIRFIEDIFEGAKGRQLTPLECHDIMCMIARSVVVGGVRRSAMISLSDLDDSQMAQAKGVFKVISSNRDPENGNQIKIVYVDADDRVKEHMWSPVPYEDDRELSELQQGRVNWWRVQPQRALSNNSAVHERAPSAEVFLDEWNSMVKSKSGERGIFSRAAARNTVKKIGRRDPDHDFGTNPCSK